MCKKLSEAEDESIVSWIRNLMTPKQCFYLMSWRSERTKQATALERVTSMASFPAKNNTLYYFAIVSGAKSWTPDEWRSSLLT